MSSKKWPEPSQDQGSPTGEGQDPGGGERETGIVGRIYGNLAKLMGGKAVAGLASLGYMVLALRTLGVRDYGVLILVHAYTVAIGGIIEFPGWHAVVRYGAIASAGGDTPRLVRLLRLTAVVELAAGAGAVLVAALLAPVVGPHLGWSPTTVAFAVPYSFAVLATIRSTPAGYLQLTGRFDLLGVHNLVAPLVRLGGALFVVWFGGELRGFLIVWLVAALAEWSSMWALGWLVARQRLAGLPLLGSPRGAIRENTGIGRFMLASNADLTFGELAQRFSSLAVGWILGPAAAGIFAVAQRSTTIISQPAGNLGQSSYAEFARLIAGGGSGRDIRQAFTRAILIAFAVAFPLLLLIGFFGRQFAVLVGGPSLVAAGAIMLWLFVARTLLIACPPASAALVALGRPGLSVVANLVTSLVLLPFLPLLMMEYGLEGAAAHAVIQASATSALLIGLLWRVTDVRKPSR